MSDNQIIIRKEIMFYSICWDSLQFIQAAKERD